MKQEEKDSQAFTIPELDYIFKEVMENYEVCVKIRGSFYTQYYAGFRHYTSLSQLCSRCAFKEMCKATDFDNLHIIPPCWNSGVHLDGSPLELNQVFFKEINNK